MLARDSRVLAVMLGFLLGFATIRAEEIPDGVMPKRQAVGTGVTSSTSHSSSTSSTTPNQPSSTTPNSGSTTNGGSTSNGGTTSQSQQQSTSVPSTSNGSPITSSNSNSAAGTSKNSAVQTSTNSKGNSIIKVGSTTINPSTLSHKTTVREPLVTKETHLSTYTSFYTSAGQRYSSVYTTENVVASTTGYVSATITPGLANGGGSGSNLSSHAKNIIGGVVGGIGGAILIGGLAFVAWRLWGKKKAAADEGDAYYQNDSQEGSIRQQKRASMGTVLSGSAYSDGGTNGLERYQNPNGAVNASSNF